MLFNARERSCEQTLVTGLQVFAPTFPAQIKVRDYVATDQNTEQAKAKTAKVLIDTAHTTGKTRLHLQFTAAQDLIIGREVAAAKAYTPYCSNSRPLFNAHLTKLYDLFLPASS